MNLKGYKDILLGDKDCIVPTDDENLEALKDQKDRERKKELRRLNEEAYELSLIHI